MTDNTIAAEWFDRLTDLATNGPADGEIEDARRFIEQAERMTALARALIAKPPTTTPAKARMAKIQRYPVTPTG